VSPRTPSQHAPRLELRRVALDQIPPLDLVVAPGDVVAVSGWNSSPLLWAVAGLRPPASGEILVDGHPVGDREGALDAGVALISAISPLASLLTAYENVLLPLTAHRAYEPPPGARRLRPDGDPVAAAQSALDSVGLLESADHLIEDLSGGQQQRVAIARALAGQPRLLLADQATTDLDAGNRSRVIALLRDLARADAAVVLASDDPAILDTADRSVTLDPSTELRPPRGSAG
jgi:putative ABC transport system ATP-binding protein